jgi:hypothetical protein
VARVRLRAAWRSPWGGRDEWLGEKILLKIREVHFVATVAGVQDSRRAVERPWDHPGEKVRGKDSIGDKLMYTPARRKDKMEIPDSFPMEIPKEKHSWKKWVSV